MRFAWLAAALLRGASSDPASLHESSGSGAETGSRGGFSHTRFDVGLRCSSLSQIAASCSVQTTVVIKVSHKRGQLWSRCLRVLRLV